MLLSVVVFVTLMIMQLFFHLKLFSAIIACSTMWCGISVCTVVLGLELHLLLYMIVSGLTLAMFQL